MKHAKLINVVLFQITWFACVAGGTAWGLSAVSLMLLFSWRTGLIWVDLAFASVAAIVGLLLDTIWIQAGVLDYGATSIAPPWIVMLWVAVGLSINHSLVFFKARPLLGGVLAGVAAPGCYLGGQSLGAVTVPEPLLLLVVSTSWLALFWLAFYLVGTRPLAIPDIGYEKR